MDGGGDEEWGKEGKGPGTGERGPKHESPLHSRSLLYSPNKVYLPNHKILK